LPEGENNLKTGARFLQYRHNKPVKDATFVNFTEKRYKLPITDTCNKNLIMMKKSDKSDSYKQQRFKTVNKKCILE